jgi:hypothetical protein
MAGALRESIGVQTKQKASPLQLAFNNFLLRFFFPYRLPDQKPIIAIFSRPGHPIRRLSVVIEIQDWHSAAFSQFCLGFSTFKFLSSAIEPPQSRKPSSYTKS